MGISLPSPSRAIPRPHRDVRIDPRRRRTSGRARSLLLILVTVAVLPSCLDSVAFESSLEGVIIERTTKKQYRETNTVSVFLDPTMAPRTYVEIARLTTTVISPAEQVAWSCGQLEAESAAARRAKTLFGTPGKSEARERADAERVHLWAQLFFGKPARRLGADGVIVTGWDARETCDPEVVEELAQVGQALEALDETARELDLGSGRTGRHVLRSETTLHAIAVKYETNPPSPGRPHDTQ